MIKRQYIGSKFTSKLLISIIIPVFNRKDLIPDTLYSIKKQTHQTWECIIIDDGSEDDTIQVIKEYTSTDKRFRILERINGPKGAPTCRNIGISEVKGDYFMFLDSDDLLHHNCLTNRLQYAIKYPKYDAWVFPSRFIRNGKLLDKYFYHIDSRSFPELAFLLRPQWPINGSFFNTSKYFSKLTLFCETMPFWQDWEFHINCIINGIQFFQTYDSICDSYIRIHDDSNRINNQIYYTKKEIGNLYKNLFALHIKLKNKCNNVDSLFQYRLLYLISYLIYRENSPYIKLALNYINDLDSKLDVITKLLLNLIRENTNSTCTNKIILQLLSLNNRRVFKAELYKLKHNNGSSY